MKSKKRWFVTALTACLTLSLGICAEALEYDFDGVEDTEYWIKITNKEGITSTGYWVENHRNRTYNYRLLGRRPQNLLGKG